ncbi:MAG: nucleotidyl transferase AbiEii/AbiGii toxin family protein [Ectothiorhodospiraceae bacterium]|nr:nucleotidyl transferase AbiEii/AbiGii toxin family protein [Ectothiorhodospiraceae bacterium]
MIDLIQKRLSEYKVAGPLEEENALKEIIQEIMLFSLWQADFFGVAAFQGGTSLRILHKLPRFSEDMDFILLTPDSAFSWKPYLEKLTETCKQFGIQPEALDKARMDQRIKKAIVKDTSIANQLTMRFMDDLNGRKLTLKLEIDCNPPTGSDFDYSYLDFPVDFEVCHQDVSSNFALKIHAILCRKYLKGRDWYDFSWYIAQGVRPNLLLLENALIQYGPWQEENLNIDQNWLVKTLGKKINSITWKTAADDVERFMKPVERKSLSLWSKRFFMAKLKTLYGINN